MKRRHFCHAAISSACLMRILGQNLASASSSKSSPIKVHHNWVVLYWMPYDNELMRFGEPILKMLTSGTRDSETLVVVQSDYWGDTKMRRRLLKNGTIHEIELLEQDSSDVSTFSAYLDWAHQTMTAEHWAVIVVGHGGKINEISPDDGGGNWQTRTWMGVDQFAQAVSYFNRATDGRVELLFFQNCNKATLEVVYEARNCARYTLASQLNLGAPNYYYEGFLSRLKEPSVDGREAAISIMNSERADMYHTLTLVDNQVVRQIPEKLSPLVQLIFNTRLPTIEQPKFSTYTYSNERHCDALGLLDYLSSRNSQAWDKFTQFTEFLQSSVISHYKTGGEFYDRRFRHRATSEKLRGLSLYFPETSEEISRYSSLALYREVDLVNLYRKLFKIE
ncbi:clostripain-related cysteine peptidase [Capilliphycus salinus ALCB114379]|uniref:clostripain-related cysteine peptidase n=1 Tax=Capilliphycus salinus TaxID=2768948 RepID=UPI0039A4C7FE